MFHSQVYCVETTWGTTTIKKSPYELHIHHHFVHATLIAKYLK